MAPLGKGSDRSLVAAPNSDKLGQVRIDHHGTSCARIVRMRMLVKGLASLAMKDTKWRPEPTSKTGRNRKATRVEHSMTDHGRKEGPRFMGLQRQADQGRKKHVHLSSPQGLRCCIGDDWKFVRCGEEEGEKDEVMRTSTTPWLL